MEFRNMTPFSVMEYAMDDKHNERHNPPLAHVVCEVNPLGLGYAQPW